MDSIIAYIPHICEQKLNNLPISITKSRQRLLRFRPKFVRYLTFNPLIATLKPQRNGRSYSNTVIGTLAVDWWAVTFGIAKRGLGGAAAHPGPSSLYQM